MRTLNKNTKTHIIIGKTHHLITKRLVRNLIQLDDGKFLTESRGLVSI